MKGKIITSGAQTAVAIFLIVIGIWRLNESGTDWRAFISFGLALANLWYVIDRHS